VAKLVTVQLEECDDNPCAAVFYAYFEGTPDEADFAKAIEACKEGFGLSPDEDHPPLRVEAPTTLSRYAGLQRWHVANPA